MMSNFMMSNFHSKDEIIHWVVALKHSEASIGDWVFEKYIASISTGYDFGRN